MYLSQCNQNRLSKKTEISQILNAYYPSFNDIAFKNFTYENKLERTSNISRDSEGAYCTNSHAITIYKLRDLNNLRKNKKYKVLFESIISILSEFMIRLEQEKKRNINLYINNDKSKKESYLLSLNSLIKTENSIEILVSKLNLLFYNNSITYDYYTNTLALIKLIEEEQSIYNKKFIANTPNSFIGETYYYKINDSFNITNEKFFDSKSKFIINKFIDSFIRYDSIKYSILKQSKYNE